MSSMECGRPQYTTERSRTPRQDALRDVLSIEERRLASIRALYRDTRGPVLRFLFPKAPDFQAEEAIEREREASLTKVFDRVATDPAYVSAVSRLLSNLAVAEVVGVQYTKGNTLAARANALESLRTRAGLKPQETPQQ